MILYSKEQDGTLNVLICGKVSREPELKENQKGNKVRFSVAYGKSKYMDCEAWADSDAGAVSGCLEKGDTVIVLGAHRSWEYNGKTYSSLTVDGVFPMTAPSAAAPAATQGAEATQGSFSDLMDAEDGLPF